MILTAKGLAAALGLLLMGGYGVSMNTTPADPLGDPTAPDVPDDGVDLPPGDVAIDRDGKDPGCGCRDHGFLIGFMARWGYLPDRNNTDEPDWSTEVSPAESDGFSPPPEDPEGRFDMVPWDGFLQVTDGGVRLVRTLLFERGGDYRLGGDDLVYRQRNRLALEWRSSTTVHWDGILAVLAVPMDRPVPHVTFHTDQWSRIFEAPNLPGLHLRVPTDRLGHEVEIRAFPVQRDCDRGGDFAVIQLRLRWGFLDPVEGRDAQPPAIPWDGFVEATKGAVQFREALLFERGGEYRFGMDDLVYPQTNRLTVEWRSSTLPYWDGIVVAVLVPLDAMPEAHVTLHTDQWSHVFEAHQLVGLDRVIPTDGLGHEIEIHGELLRP